MEHTTRLDRTTGAWLAGSAVAFIAALALHPPPQTEISAFAGLIAEKGDVWVAAHWLAALALSGFAVTAFLALTAPRTASQPRLARAGWALLAVGALATTTTAVAEATVIADAAAAQDMATFAAWQAFAEGFSMGFAVMAIGIAGIASAPRQAADDAVPRWSARVATMLALVAAAAWVLGMGAGVPAGPPIWLVTTIVLSLWLVWYGVASLRTRTTNAAKGGIHA